MLRNTFPFLSEFRLGAALPDFDQETVKNEPMLFNCDFDTAWELGGPITRAFLEKLPSKNAIIDTRVHMLMPGWFPCIPGYHHDDIPRTRYDGQPDYVAPPYHANHVMALINGDIAPTEFAVGECWLDEVLPGEGPIYRVWHEVIEKLIALRELKRVSAPSNRLIWFNHESFHQGVPAVGDGWRWFARASFNTHRKPTNELRRQVQVYLENPMDGW